VTIAALALINVGVATSIVSLMQSVAFAPLWVGLVLMGIGVATAFVAVRLWQNYLLALRQR
jgi:hypothetical protein